MSFTEVTATDKLLACECCERPFQILYHWTPGTALAPGYKELYCVRCSKRPNTRNCHCYDREVVPNFSSHQDDAVFK